MEALAPDNRYDAAISTASRSMVRLQGVGLRYAKAGRGGPEILRDLGFYIPAGGFRWLVGPSGAGKTSLLRLLYLAERPSSGRLEILGQDVGQAPRDALPLLRRRIGVVFQDFRLLNHLSVFDNVALPLRLARRPEEQLRADVHDLLQWVGLGNKMDCLPALLSGGEQQRVAISRAVVNRPALLVADEPTGNLDAEQAHRLMQLLAEMNRLGTTVVVATHNTTLLAEHPADLLRLERGYLVEDTAAAQLPPATLPRDPDEVEWDAPDQVEAPDGPEEAQAYDARADEAPADEARAIDSATLERSLADSSPFRYRPLEWSPPPRPPAGFSPRRRLPADHPRLSPVPIEEADGQPGYDSPEPWDELMPPREPEP
jgi:cell division transport system ATP-binding protein